ncbi:MAG: penicillin acylase family protein [bacterium]|jgi:penicillin amidase|nr:penicillin acylase family protein [candidate division KSB1 bacterium]MDH7561113.1 penicillin acylase family protein [bacterium]
MGRLKRVLLGLLIVLVVGVFSALLFGYLTLRRALPQTSGTLELAGLHAPVDVLRDAQGVPHIFARDEHDLLMAQGFVTAQDRLWQMDLMRRAARGQLAELFGTQVLEHDRLMRTIGIGRTAAALYQRLPEESRAALDAYAEGVNAFLGSGRHRLPVECLVLRYAPSRWRGEDCVAIIRFVSWALCMSWAVDLTYGALAGKVDPQRLSEILPVGPYGGPRVTDIGDREDYRLCLDALHALTKARAQVGLAEGALGSNNWALSGSKTTTGKPVLCNDPHLMLSVPAFWYEVHLCGGGIDACGMSIPGLPGMSIGRNRRIAWGITNGMIDDADFFVERVDTADAYRYLRDGQWLTMSTVAETIAVKGAAPVVHEVHLTVHGPVINDVHALAGKVGKAIALRWVGHDYSDEIAALRMVIRANSWSEVLAGLQSSGTPAQNFVYADADGNIGYLLGGTVPSRGGADGVLPRPGWEAKNDWQGRLPFERHPRLFNPAKGFVATANNEIWDQASLGYLSAYWEPPDRITRITQTIEGKPQLSREDCERLQMDRLSLRAKAVVPLFLRAYERAALPDTGLLHQAYLMLRGWDCVEEPQSLACTVFHAAHRHLLHNIFADEMGEELFTAFVAFPGVAFRVTDQVIARGNSPWFDDISTPEKSESLDDLLVRSLVDGVAELRGERGPELSRWQWGEVHAITIHHAFSQAPVLGKYFDIGPFPIGGSTTTVCNIGYPLGEPYHPHWGVSMRMVVDFAEGGVVRFVLPTGQSGHRMSKHYADQTRAWLQGRYHVTTMDRQALHRAPHKLLVLRPRQERRS